MKRMEWIDGMAENFKERERMNPQTAGAIIIGNRIAVVDLVTSRIGVAWCSPTDDFDLNTGLAIAYARMIGVKVPQSVIDGRDGPQKKMVCVSTLKNGQKFVFDGHDYIYCGVDTTSCRKDRYIVYRVKDGLLQHFWSARDGGEKVEIKIDD